MYIHLRSLADFGTPLGAAFLPQILIMARCMLYELKASHGERYTTDEQILGSDLQRRHGGPRGVAAMESGKSLQKHFCISFAKEALRRDSCYPA